MELIKKIIHTNNRKQNIRTQVTLDDDYNVPDSKPDVEKITATKGEIEITEAEAQTDKIKVRGNCHFHVLYMTDMDSYPVSSLEGTLPFEETINGDGIVPSDTVKVKALLEDLTISIINSRKLSIRCLMHLRASVSEDQQLEAATSVEQPLPTRQQQILAPAVETLHKSLNMTTMVINKKDIYRLREALTIPSNKPDLHEIIWSSSTLNNPDVKVNDGSLILHGDLSIFLLYTSEVENAPLQFLDMELPFKGELSCENCMEGMISNIDMRILTTQYAIKPDNDGEQRIVDVECVLELDIKLYEEETVKLLWDAYSPKAELQIAREPFHYSKLLVKNNAKTRITQRAKRPDAKDTIMQICHVEGQVKLDEYTMQEDGIQVEGIVNADILYISANDDHPINASTLMVPFHYLVEIEGIHKDCNYEITATLEQLSVNMLDGNELELKAIVSLCAIAFENEQGAAIKSIDASPLNPEKMQKLPGMIGYIVKENDDLWNIAKRYYTTTTSIQNCNHLETADVQPGEKLIIVK